jgi:hypothetical protein
MYADRDATIKGTSTNKKDEWTTYIYNVTLKKGWNYIICSSNEKTRTTTYTSSTTQPSGFIWTVIPNSPEDGGGAGTDMRLKMYACY